MRRLRRWSVVFALALLACFAAASALAQGPPVSRRGRLIVSLPDGAPGPLILGPGQGGWVGQLTITNVGPDPLTVSRISIRGAEDDVRSPSRVSVHFAEGAPTSATLAPGAAKDVVVSWMPDKDPRVRQAFGHVVVTSTDERAGEVAMGFRAQLPTGLGWIGEHALSLLVLWPLSLLLVAAGSRLSGRRDEPLVRRAAVVVAATELALSLWAGHHFEAGVGRVDGNDGFQLVERAVWVRSAGTEWYLGVDGTSMSLVVLSATLALVAFLVPGPRRAGEAHDAALGLLVSAVMGALVALDLTVLFVSWGLILLALVLLIGGWGGPRSAQAAAKLGIYGLIGAAAMLIAFVALSGASGRTFLVDGSPVAHTTSIPELSRTSFASSGSLPGVSLAQAVWVLLVVAAAVWTPIVPFHGWFADAVEQGPPGATIVLGGVVVALGPYLLVRVGLGAVPEGARYWMSGLVAALGVLGAGWGSLCALAQRDLRRFVAYATLASAGASLFGVAALTPQGIAGGVAGLFAHGAAVAMLLGFSAAIEGRVHTSDATRLGGLAREIPGLAAVMAVGLAVSASVPGFVGGWGTLLVMLGGFAWHPVLAMLLAAALVVSIAAHGRIARLALLGRVPEAWRSSAELAAFGHRFPDATPSESAVLVPLALLALLLGIWPAPLLSPIAAAARDASEAVRGSGGD